MNNKEKSVGTTAEKSTTVETQHPSSHSNGNTFVVCRLCCSLSLIKQSNRKSNRYNCCKCAYSICPCTIFFENIWFAVALFTFGVIIIGDSFFRFSESSFKSVQLNIFIQLVKIIIGIIFLIIFWHLLDSV